MLLRCASFPLLRVVPSLRMRTGCPEPVVVKYAMLFLPLFSRVELCFLIGNKQKASGNINIYP
jgi:hypothetical protein